MITARHRRMQPWISKKLTWIYRYTAMRGIWTSQNHAVERGGVFSCQTVTCPLQIMGACKQFCKIIKAVMYSTAEVKLGALFFNTREYMYMWKILKKMGHKQYQTPMQKDKQTVEGVINKNIQPKCTKIMDMRFHWLQSRESQEQFRYFWRLGTRNRGYYWKTACTRPSSKYPTRYFDPCPTDVRTEKTKTQWK